MKYRIFTRRSNCSHVPNEWRKRSKEDYWGSIHQVPTVLSPPWTSVKMEGLAESFAANFTVSFEPNDTAAPHPRYTACLFKDDFNKRSFRLVFIPFVDRNNYNLWIAHHERLMYDVLSPSFKIIRCFLLLPQQLRAFLSRFLRTNVPGRQPRCSWNWLIHNMLWHFICDLLLFLCRMVQYKVKPSNTPDQYLRRQRMLEEQKK